MPVRDVCDHGSPRLHFLYYLRNTITFCKDSGTISRYLLYGFEFKVLFLLEWLLPKAKDLNMSICALYKCTLDRTHNGRYIQKYKHSTNTHTHIYFSFIRPLSTSRAWLQFYKNICQFFKVCG